MRKNSRCKSTNNSNSEIIDKHVVLIVMLVISISRSSYDQGTHPREHPMDERRVEGMKVFEPSSNLLNLISLIPRILSCTPTTLTHKSKSVHIRATRNELGYRSVVHPRRNESNSMLAKIPVHSKKWQDIRMVKFGPPYRLNCTAFIDQSSILTCFVFNKYACT